MDCTPCSRPSEDGAPRSHGARRESEDGARRRPGRRLGRRSPTRYATRSAISRGSTSGRFRSRRHRPRMRRLPRADRAVSGLGRRRRHLPARGRRDPSRCRRSSPLVRSTTRSRPRPIGSLTRSCARTYRGPPTRRREALRPARRSPGSARVTRSRGSARRVTRRWTNGPHPAGSSSENARPARATRRARPCSGRHAQIPRQPASRLPPSSTTCSARPGSRWTHRRAPSWSRASGTTSAACGSTLTDARRSLRRRSARVPIRSVSTWCSARRPFRRPTSKAGGSWRTSSRTWCSRPGPSGAGTCSDRSRLVGRDRSSSAIRPARKRRPKRRSQRARRSRGSRLRRIKWSSPTRASARCRARTARSGNGRRAVGWRSTASAPKAACAPGASRRCSRRSCRLGRSRSSSTRAPIRARIVRSRSCASCLRRPPRGPPLLSRRQRRRTSRWTTGAARRSASTSRTRSMSCGRAIRSASRTRRASRPRRTSTLTSTSRTPARSGRGGTTVPWASSVPRRGNRCRSRSSCSRGATRSSRTRSSSPGARTQRASTSISCRRPAPTFSRSPTRSGSTATRA